MLDCNGSGRRSSANTLCGGRNSKGVGSNVSVFSRGILDYRTQYIQLFTPSTLPCGEATPTHPHTLPLPSSHIPLVLSLCCLLISIPQSLQNGLCKEPWGETRGRDLLWTNDGAKNIACMKRGACCQISQPVLLSFFFFFTFLSTVLGACGLF